MSQDKGDTYYQGTQFRIVKDEKGNASNIEWVEAEEEKKQNSNLNFRPSKPPDQELNHHP